MRITHLLRRAALLALAIALVVAGPSAAAERMVEFALPPGTSGVTDIAPGPDGAVWVAAAGSRSLIRVAPSGSSATVPVSITAPTVAPRALVTGADGNLWFTDDGDSGIVRTTPAGAATRFSEGLSADAQLGDVALGADGNVWFTEGTAARIGRITPTGAITEFPVAAAAIDLTSGADGAIWFTTANGVVGRLTGAGEERYVPLPGGAVATGITAGPDASVWLSTTTGVLRVGLDGSVRPHGQGTWYRDIALGPDRHLWATGGLDDVSRFTADGVTVSDFVGPTESVTAPVLIAPGHDGNLWYVAGFRVGLVQTTMAPSFTKSFRYSQTADSATVQIDANAEGLPTQAYLVYGPSEIYGTRTPAQAIDGVATHPLTFTIPGLKPFVIYHFSLLLENEKGITATPDTPFEVWAPVPPPASPITQGTKAKAVVGGAGLTVTAKSAKVSARGVATLPVACSATMPCDAAVRVTARLGGKRSKVVLIAAKDVDLAAGARLGLGLRMNSAARKAIRRAGRRGVAALVTVDIGGVKTRTRVVLKG